MAEQAPPGRASTSVRGARNGLAAAAGCRRPAGAGPSRAACPPPRAALAFISAKVPPYTALEQTMWSPLEHSASSVDAMALMPAVQGAPAGGAQGRLRRLAQARWQQRHAVHAVASAGHAQGGHAAHMAAARLLPKAQLPLITRSAAHPRHSSMRPPRPPAPPAGGQGTGRSG